MRRARRGDRGRRSPRRSERSTSPRDLVSLANAPTRGPRAAHGRFPAALARRPANDVPVRDLDHFLDAIVGLLALEDPHAAARRAVEVARDSIGLVRVSIYLAEQFDDLLAGTWASDSKGSIVNEQHVHYAVGKTDRKALLSHQRAPPYTVFDNCLIVEHRPSGRQVAARSWGACTPVRCGDDIVGVVLNDGGSSQATFDEGKQTKLAMLAFLLGAVIRSSKAATTCVPRRIDRMALHRLVMAAVGLLARDPGASAFAVARRLGSSPKHLQRAFEAQLGMSLLEYRNRMRLHRVAIIVGCGRTSLPDAVVAAGFKTCAHFERIHRTFGWLRRSKRRAN